MFKFRIPVSPMQKVLLYSLASAPHYTSPSEVSLLIRKIYMEYSESDDILKPCKMCRETKKITNLCIKCEQVSIASAEEFKLFRRTFIDVIEKVKYDDTMKDLKHSKRGPVVLFIDEVIFFLLL